MRALRCEACGGAVQVQVGRELPNCLFCGVDLEFLKPFEPAAGGEPEEYVDFALSPGDADSKFERWSKSWFMAPSKLRKAEVELAQVFVPALRFSANMETYWAGKVIDHSNRSGKRPLSGVANECIDGAYIPVSSALTQSEIRELGTFGEHYQPWAGANRDIPWEVEHKSARSAHGQAVTELRLRHQALIVGQNDLIEVSCSTLPSSLRSVETLVPVYIGVFHFRGEPWRLLVNGVTGEIVGKKPWSRAKVAFAIGVIASFVLSPCVVAPALLLFFAGWMVGLIED